MPYVDLAGLSRFAGKSKDFASSACAGPDMANWQKTAAAGAVSFAPVPEMPLDPVVNFLFSETGPASGTKGPDNPSTIAGVSSVVLAHGSSNIFYLNGFPSSFASVSISVDADGVIELNGTCVATQIDGRQWVQPIAPPARILRLPGQYLHAKIEHLSGTLTTTGTMDRVLSEMSETIIDTGAVNYRYVTTSSPTATFAPSTSLQRLGRPTISFYGGQTFTNYRFRVMYEISDSPQMSEYDPPHTVFTTIPLGDTYYGGSVDLSTGIMTVTHVIKPLIGTERISSSATAQGTTRVEYSTFAVGDNLPASPSAASQTSTHLAFSTSPSFNFEHFFIDSTGRLKIFLNVSSEEDALAWLVSQNTAGTPFSVVYPLANPYTVQLTPTQIKSLLALSKYEPRTNTVYSDQESVQVGYPKSPIATDNELTNAIISLGGNV